MVPKGKKLFVELLNKGYSDSRSHYTAFNGDISDLYGLDAMFAYLIHLGYLALDSDQQIVRLINGELKTALTCAFAAGLLARQVFLKIRAKSQECSLLMFCEYQKSLQTSLQALSLKSF